MNVIETAIDGVLILEPKKFGDSRGFFVESYQKERYQNIGIQQEFVQDNHSRSSYGILRGLHFQKKKPQGKLVRVTQGRVLDVAADINPESNTFGQHVAVELNEENCRQFWVPPGFAHGFVVLSEIADFMYKCTDYYDPSDEGGVIWNDPQIGIDWQIKTPTLSPKDLQLPTLSALFS